MIPLVKRLFAIGLLVNVCAGGGGVAVAQDVLSRSTLTAEEKLLGLSRVWQETRFSFAYFSNIANDWDRLYTEFIPRVMGTATDYAYYLELMRFAAHLRDGHSGVFWPAAFDEALGYPPLEIRAIDGKAVIFRILRDTAELAEHGIRPGLAIVNVDERPVAELVSYWRALKAASTAQATDRLAYFRILTGPRNSQVNVRLEDPSGQLRTVRLTRSEKYFNDSNLDPAERHMSRRDGAAGYFQANQMHPEVSAAFATFIESAKDMRGLVLDLRYNGGGSDTVAFEMVSRLIDQPLKGPIYEVTSYRADRRAYRQEQEAIRTQPTIAPARGARFTGPLVVLIGEQSHSATESGFLSVIRGRPQTTMVGEPTAGSTGQPLIFPLPGGAIAAVCSIRSLPPNGTEFVGVGFQPDIFARLTQREVYDAHDGVLDTALRSLKR